MRTFSVKNFDKFQHYRDRTPPWIKLYNDLLDDYDFGCLPDASKWHLIAIWLLASRSGNRIPLDQKWVSRRINANDEVDLQLLLSSGFLVENQEVQQAEQDASKTLDLARSREGETEGEREKETRAQDRVDDIPPDPKPEDQFDEWYSDYPHKVGRGAALRAFKAAIKKTDLATLKAALDRYIREKPADRSWCNPATWLNQERWLDAPAATTAPPGTPSASPAADSVRLLNHNEADRAAVIRKVIRFRTGDMQEWRFNPQWSDEHPPGHPQCVIPQDLIDEADRQVQSSTKQRAAG